MGCSASRQVIVSSSKKCLESEGFNNNMSVSVAPPVTDDVEQIVTEEEKLVIRKTWTILLQDLPAIGKQVFLKIFEMQPSIKEMFPFRHVWGDSLITHPQFKAHVLRFMMTVGTAIDNMDSGMGAFGQAMYTLGTTHTLHRGFTVGYFDAFLTAMLFVWQQELKMDPEMMVAWRKLLKFVMDKLKDGYNDQLKKDKELRSPGLTPPQSTPAVSPVK